MMVLKVTSLSMRGNQQSAVALAIYFREESLIHICIIYFLTSNYTFARDPTKSLAAYISMFFVLKSKLCILLIKLES